MDPPLPPFLEPPSRSVKNRTKQPPATCVWQVVRGRLLQKCPISVTAYSWTSPCSAKEDVLISFGVCLSVCQRDNSENWRIILNKFIGWMRCVTSKNWLDFGEGYVTLRLRLGSQLPWRRFALSECFLFCDNLLTRQNRLSVPSKGKGKGAYTWYGASS